MLLSLNLPRALALGTAVFATCGLSAQEDVRAARAPLTLSLTLTESIGGYKITPLKEDADFFKGLSYAGILNPHDLDAEAAGFNYYSERTTLKERRLADGFVYPVETIVQTSRKAATRRYLTADFIKDLIARGGVLAEAPGDANAWRGYLLVAVTFKGYDEDRRYLFAEKAGKAPVFLGWETREGDSPLLTDGHFLTFELLGGAEGGLRTDSQKIAYITERFDGQVSIVEDIFDVPAPTRSERANGKAEVRMRIFPGDTLPLRDLRFGGRAAYSKKYDARQAVELNGRLAATGLAGNKYEVETPNAMVEGTVVIGPEVMVKPTAAITAETYWAAVPEALRPALE